MECHYSSIILKLPYYSWNYASTLGSGLIHLGFRESLYWIPTGSHTFCGHASLYWSPCQSACCVITVIILYVTLLSSVTGVCYIHTLSSTLNYWTKFWSHTSSSSKWKVRSQRYKSQILSSGIDAKLSTCSHKEVTKYLQVTIVTNRVVLTILLLI